MRNLVKDVFNTPFSEIAINLIVSCWVTITVSLNLDKDWTDIAVGAAIAGGIILVLLLVWATVMLVMKKQVTVMPFRVRKMFEGCGWFLLAYCILTNMIPELAVKSMIPVSWIVSGICIITFVNTRLRCCKAR